MLEGDGREVVDPLLEEERGVEEVEQPLHVLGRVRALGWHRTQARRGLLETLGEALMPRVILPTAEPSLGFFSLSAMKGSTCSGLGDRYGVGAGAWAGAGWG